MTVLWPLRRPNRPMTAAEWDEFDRQRHERLQRHRAVLRALYPDIDRPAVSVKPCRTVWAKEQYL